MALGDTRGPDPMDRPHSTALAMASELVMEIDRLGDIRDTSLKSALCAWIREDGSDGKGPVWEAISALLMDMTGDTPDSARTLRRGIVDLLGALVQTVVSHDNSGHHADVAWDVSYVWIAAMRTAKDKIDAALEAVERDAARLVSA